jgi:hypothetical protein
MPLYPIVNEKTGETKELEMSIAQWGEWKEQNEPLGWKRDWSQGCASPGEVGEWKNKLVSKHPDWNTVLKSASKAPGSRVKPI